MALEKWLRIAHAHRRNLETAGDQRNLPHLPQRCEVFAVHDYLVVAVRQGDGHKRFHSLTCREASQAVTLQQLEKSFFCIMVYFSVTIVMTTWKQPTRLVLLVRHSRCNNATITGIYQINKILMRFVRLDGAIRAPNPKYFVPTSYPETASPATMGVAWPRRHYSNCNTVPDKLFCQLRVDS